MIRIEKNKFHLVGDNYQYDFYEEDGRLYHAYYGMNIGDFYCDCTKDSGALLEEPKEYAEFGRGDFRIPAFVVHTNNSLSTDLRFESYEILNKKPSIGMPAMRGEKQTLAVKLKDERLGLRVTLFYTP